MYPILFGWSVVPSSYVTSSSIPLSLPLIIPPGVPHSSRLALRSSAVIVDVLGVEVVSCTSVVSVVTSGCLL